ncbi:MAG: phosphate signaling complex protein PhoU [Armatimonadia bacterium]
MIRTRKAFDEQLSQLEQKLLQFGAFVEAMLEKAIRALADQDLNLAREVIADDDTADDMDLEIEQFCMRLLALQQPMSRDLRMIGTTMKVIADVERIGDYSVDIAKAAISMADTEYFKPLVDIPRMSDIVRQMLRRALEALVRRDMDLAREVVKLDSQVDEVWYLLFKELEQIMQERPETVRQAVMFLLVARYLERIADHIQNVAERVIYIETGHLQKSDDAEESDVLPSVE